MALDMGINYIGVIGLKGREQTNIASSLATFQAAPFYLSVHRAKALSFMLATFQAAKSH